MYSSLRLILQHNYNMAGFESRLYTRCLLLLQSLRSEAKNLLVQEEF